MQKTVKIIAIVTGVLAAALLALAMIGGGGIYALWQFAEWSMGGGAEQTLDPRWKATKFDSAMWKRNEGHDRFRMAEDLVHSRALIGKSLKEVVTEELFVTAADHP